MRARSDCGNGGFQLWFADTARGKVCDLVLVTSGGRFNIRRRSVALAGPQFPQKIGGGGECAYSGSCAYISEYGKRNLKKSTPTP